MSSNKYVYACIYIYGKREELYNPLKYQAGVGITICMTTLISSKGLDLDRKAYPNSNQYTLDAAQVPIIL